MDLLVPEVREDRRENRRLDDVLRRVRGVPVASSFRVAKLRRRALVRTASSAKDAVRDIVCAVVAAHGR